MPFIVPPVFHVCTVLRGTGFDPPLGARPLPLTKLKRHCHRQAWFKHRVVYA